MKQQVHGNVTGVRDTLIEALGQLYDYEVDEDTFLPHELMQVLARFTGVLNREIAVYITRDGEVVDVSIGTDRDVELRDYRLRRNTQRLSCVRCIHTHPNGDGRLSDVDLSALRSFRYDAMVAIGCLKGEPTFVQSAFLVEKQNLLMDEPVRWYKTPDGDWMRQITESDRIVGWEADEKGTHVKERAVLMGIESMESLDELARLADTAGAEVVGQFLQKKDKPDTALFIGRGRADELCRQCQALEADLCIFDEELTGIQARNLEEILRVKVVDRTTLILDIFAQRASSAEGKLQVELAQLQYQSSRLIGQGLVLSRLAGGIGTLGAIGLARSHLKLGGAVETIATLPMMIPELVLGMAYLSVFTAVGFKLGMGALVLTHTTFCIPYVFINVKSRLIGMDPSLSEAARDLGASPARVLKDITLPLIFPAVLSGMMLSAAMSLDDHPAAQGLHRPAFRRHAGDQRALHPDARRDLYLCGRYSIDNGQKQRKTPISIKRIPRLR